MSRRANHDPTRRPFGGPLRRLLLASLVVSLVSCTTGTSLLRPSPAPEKAGWQLPSDAFPTQRLYRVHYDGPEGKLGFRLTLYLMAESHYRMEASDTLGRRVWSLAVDPDDRAVWLDHRNETYCRTFGRKGQSFVPIAHLPLAALPRLILGRLPAPPANERQAQLGGGKLAYVDAAGQTWNGQLGTDGRLAWWSLVEDGEAVAWWRFVEGESIFSDRRGGQQVRWREQVRESLARPAEPLAVPDGYRQGVCVPAASTHAAP